MLRWWRALTTVGFARSDASRSAVHRKIAFQLQDFMAWFSAQSRLPAHSLGQLPGPIQGRSHETDRPPAGDRAPPSTREGASNSTRGRRSQQQKKKQPTKRESQAVSFLKNLREQGDKILPPVAERSSADCWPQSGPFSSVTGAPSSVFGFLFLNDRMQRQVSERQAAHPHPQARGGSTTRNPRSHSKAHSKHDDVIYAQLEYVVAFRARVGLFVFLVALPCFRSPRLAPF